MKKATKLLALLLAVVMCVFVFAACGKSKQKRSETLVVGYSPFNEKFSPFFSETAYDQDVWAMTQISLLTSDRMGTVIEKGINGTKVTYNNTEYTYYGPADLTITQNDDGSVYYDFTLRQDLKFSDGDALTIDDVIFSMYVLSDPAYDGSSTFFALPIQGMAEYRAGWDTLLNLIYNAGRDNTDYSKWTEATQKDFWKRYDEAATGLAQEIVDYCLANYADYGAVDVASSAGLWGFPLEAGATIADFAAALQAAYKQNISKMISTEAAGSSVDDLFPNLSDFSGVAVKLGDSADNISGIVKTGDYSMRVITTEIDATAIYQLGVTIAPLHYYGSAAKYDYANNKFGFDKGDLSLARAKTTKPMGAGPYKFNKFKDGVVYFEANDLYFKGAPKTKYINFQQCMTDDDKTNGVITGTIDITDPSFSTKTIKQIMVANGGTLNGDVVEGGTLNGSKIDTNTVDNLGYGYIGMCAEVMKIGEPDSDASKALRKAFGTIFSVYRELAVNSYYGDRASVINYPISNTSWAAPQATDEGYEVAFSKNAAGQAIYTSGMTAEQKYAAALEATKSFLVAAGYTWDEAQGKFTAAPEGGSLEYEAWIPADGTGDHPSFMILTEAKQALATIGINLKIKDLTDSSELWTALEAQSVAIWCAAWGASVDPDMYQIYFSGKDGKAAGGSNYMYAIADDELNDLILDARGTTNQAARKAMYKQCLDLIIDWAVEIPVYQRQNAIIFSAERVNLDTVTPDITTFYGWMAEIENTQLK